MLAGLFTSCQPSEKRRLQETVIQNTRPFTVFGLTPALTEILFDICPPSEIPNVAFGSDYPPAATKLPSIHVLPLDFEALSHAKPSLIVAEAGMHASSTLESLRKQGHTVKTLRLETIDDLFAANDSRGRWTHHPSKAQMLQEQVKVSIKPYEGRLAGMHITLGVLLFNNPFMVYGRSSWMHSKLAFLGVQNAFEVKPGVVATLLAEELMATPMNALAVPRKTPTTDALTTILEQRPRLKRITLDENLASRPSTRLPAQLQDICTALEARTH
jgi:ABC-type hemin transport system substrate-binding protein